MISVIEETDELTVVLEPVKSAEVANLFYVNDMSPGIRRKKTGKGFSYINSKGNIIKDKEEIKRINSLILPPAWKDVWICENPNGHLQATGRDAKGRKQYRYHQRWQQLRNELKFDKMLLFGQILPSIRKQIRKDLALKGIPKEKVMALVISIMSETLIRVGNSEYAEENNTFGLTTLLNKHVRIEDNKIKFKFKGKSGKFHNIDLKNKKLAKLVKQCRDLPGYDLFEYLDENCQPHSIGSSDVNSYMCSITEQNFTAKDFRTWGGSVYAMKVLQDFSGFDTQTEAKKNLVEAIKIISKKLGNTTTVCKKYYIHPKVLEAFFDGSLNKIIETSKNTVIEELKPEEVAFMTLLEQS